MSGRFLGLLAGDVSRREMLGALARWTVPTVLTMTLVTRQAQATASCPPCTQKTGGRCRACSMNQILNCQCEPCLGAPYCSNGVYAPVARPGAMTAPYSGLVPGGAASPLSPSPSSPGLMNPFYRTLRDRPAFSGRNPFDLPPGSALPRSPFGGLRSTGVPLDTLPRSRGGLYERLRPDARRPF
jgi:hypothetical protein